MAIRGTKNFRTLAYMKFFQSYLRGVPTPKVQRSIKKNTLQIKRYKRHHTSQVNQVTFSNCKQTIHKIVDLSKLSTPSKYFKVEMLEVGHCKLLNLSLSPEDNTLQMNKLEHLWPKVTREWYNAIACIQMHSNHPTLQFN